MFAFVNTSCWENNSKSEKQKSQSDRCKIVFPIWVLIPWGAEDCTGSIQGSGSMTPPKCHLHTPAADDAGKVREVAERLVGTGEHWEQTKIKRYACSQVQGPCPDSCCPWTHWVIHHQLRDGKLVRDPWKAFIFLSSLAMLASLTVLQGVLQSWALSLKCL